MSTEQYWIPSSASSLSLMPRSKRRVGRTFVFLGDPWVLPFAKDSHGGLHAAPESPLSLGLTHSHMFLVNAMTDVSVPYSFKCAAAVTILAVYGDGVI